MNADDPRVDISLVSAVWTEVHIFIWSSESLKPRPLQFVCKISIKSQRITSYSSKRILKYLKGIDNLSQFYSKSDVYDLKGYSDADYEGDLVNRKSTSVWFNSLALV